MQITENFLELTPAYGRDYKSGKEAKEAFLSGKDFVLQPEGKYCSVRDFAKGCKVLLRFKRLENVCQVVVG